MNSFAEERRKQLAGILDNQSVPETARLDQVAGFLEREVKQAFTRGLRQGRTPRKDAKP